MNKSLQTLLDESNKTISLQSEIIQNQKDQINTLSEINHLLKKENSDLKQLYQNLSDDYNEVVSMCKEQQSFINQILDPSSK